MPDLPEPPSQRRPPGQRSRFEEMSEADPPEAVLFDFHGTLAQVEEPVAWVRAAASVCGVTLTHGPATALADRLVTAGRAGGPLPVRVPPHLAEVWAHRDLDEDAHRQAYTGLAAMVDSGVDGLPEALYERSLRPAGWVAYPGIRETLATLASAGVPVAVVSNIGFDLRPLADALGLGRYITSWVLSFELGRCKPDPAIFRQACAELGVDPARTLMVGDTPADAGAIAAGCSAYVVPQAAPGVGNGVPAVLRLVGRPVLR